MGLSWGHVALHVLQQSVGQEEKGAGCRRRGAGTRLMSMQSGAGAGLCFSPATCAAVAHAGGPAGCFEIGSNPASSKGNAPGQRLVTLLWLFTCHRGAAHTLLGVEWNLRTCTGLLHP
jgi:hypothetical protein